MIVKPLLMKFVLFILFFDRIQNYSCNKRLLNSFLLTGMKYPIYSPMRVCGNVKDRCCTVGDEIKIAKLWNERAKPLLDAYNDEYMSFMGKIINKYWSLMAIDPRYTILSYVTFKKSKVNQKYCNSQEKYETDEANKEFLNHQDQKYKSVGTDDSNLKKITHNSQGDRTWGIEGVIEKEYSFLKKEKPKIEFTETKCTEINVQY